MKADQILRAGLDILVERGEQRDQPGGERTIPSVVAAFNALTGHTMTEQQGWLFMALVKVRRCQTGKPDPDHYVDGANYFALAGEAALAHPTDAFIGASMYGLPPPTEDQLASAEVKLREMKSHLAALEIDKYVDARMDRLPPLDPPANTGTIDATAYRWHELQALLRQRDEQLAGTGPSVTLDAAGTHTVAEVPDGVCAVCAGDGFENRKLGSLCRTCSGTGQC